MTTREDALARLRAFAAERDWSLTEQLGMVVTDDTEGWELVWWLYRSVPVPGGGRAYEALCVTEEFLNGPERVWEMFIEMGDAAIARQVEEEKPWHSCR